MKDTEKYAKELAGIPFSELAITKDGKICRCKEILCRNCAFYERKFPFCREAEQTEVDKDAEIACLTAEVAELRASLDRAIELPCKIGETIYTVIKNCACCQHYNVRWAECNAPATANFDCKSIHEICFTQDIIDDECKKHLFVAEMKFDLALLDPKTGKLLPCYFTDREAAEARLKELQGREGK